MTVRSTREETSKRPASHAGLRWTNDVPVVTHPLMLLNYIKLFGLTAIIMGLLMSFLMAVTGSPDAIPAMWMMAGGVCAALLVVGLLGMALIYGNRMQMTFSLDREKAVSEIADRRNKAVSAAAIILGVLARKPGAVGAGLISATDTRRSAAWRALVSARFYPQFNSISLRNSWRTVIILFCTPANYEQVAAYVREAMASRPSRESVRRNPLPKLLLHTCLIVLATLPFFLIGYPFKSDLFAAIFTLCFAMASLWILPHLSYATLLGLAALTWQVGASAFMARRSSLDPGKLYRAIDRMSADDWVQLGLFGIGVGYLVWLSVALLRGRVTAGLAGDMAALEDEPGK